MFDMRWIRENPDDFDAGLKRRGAGLQAAGLIAVDARRREAQTKAQELQTRRNELSKRIGQAKAQGDGEGEDIQALMDEVASSKDAQAAAEDAAKAAEDELHALMAGIPNLPAGEVPDGADENDNVELRTWGEPPAFDFEAGEHDDLGEVLGMMDFETAAKMSGSRFVLLSGALARLERALGQFMLDVHTGEFGYTEVSPPVLVRDDALFGSGQLPKFADDLFRTTDGRWLIPTAEVPLANIVAGHIVGEDDLPRRYTAQTLCFRSEAGASGKDTKGMIRQHQFLKVELVSVTAPDESDAEHERMTECAEEILKRLGLPYRTMVLCTGDMGFAARKTYDIEVWLPGQGSYREISSCSNCGDFQARRMMARYRPAEGKGTRYPHTLNGSGLAVGRALVAVMENYQQADGSIAVPEALKPYMGGLETIQRA